MIGLIVFTVLGIYIFICWKITKWIAKQISNPKKQVAVKVLLLPVLLVLPFADELIGKVQYDRLCREAEEVKIYGTIPVGEGLYSSDGKWLLGSRPPLPLEEYKKVESIYNSLIREDSAAPKNIKSIIPIRQYEYKIYSKQTNQLLATYQHYASSGGWLSRHMENPVIVKSQCFPPIWGVELDKKLLPSTPWTKIEPWFVERVE